MAYHVTDHWSDYDDEDVDPFELPTPELKAKLWQIAAQGPEELKRFLRDGATATWGYDKPRLLLSIDGDGNSFLHLAAKHGNAGILQALGSQEVFPCRHPPPPKQLVALARDLPVIKNKDGNTPLHIAAAHDKLEFAKALIRYHVNGRIGDPVDVDSVQMIKGSRRQPMLAPPEESYDYVPEETPEYLGMQNDAGQCAWQAAESADATKTADWLRRYTAQTQRIQKAMQS